MNGTNMRDLGANELSQIEQIMRRAALRAAPSLQGSLWRGQGAEELKGDGSIATATDVSSQNIIVTYLVAELMEAGLGDLVTVVAEEMKFAKIGDIVRTRYVILVDPQDGTALGRMGAPGMTIGVQLIDMIDGHFVAGVVVDPSGQRVAYTVAGEAYVRRLDPVQLKPVGARLRCQVSKKKLTDKGASVLIEVAHGFKRHDWMTGEQREVLDNYQVPMLIRMIQQIGQEGDGKWGIGPAVRSCSSNLMHNLLVATGGAEAFITTAIGGPWDMTNLVLGAGGVVKYCRIEHTFPVVGVVETTPLLADLVIGGNSLETVKMLHEQVVKVVNLGR